MTKFIVKEKDSGKYWKAESCGATAYKDDAYRYTAEQLKHHHCAWVLASRRAVLIPVKD